MFQLTDLKTREGALSLYLSLPAKRMAPHCFRWFRIMIELALEAMEREERKDNQTMILMDEYANAVKRLESIEVASGLIAGMGCTLVFVVQGLGQLKAIHHDHYESILGNCGLQVFFSNGDVTTMDYISKVCGKTTVIVERAGDRAFAGNTDTGAGRSRGPEVTELIQPDEAGKLFEREDPQRRMLVIKPGHSPMMLRRVRYYEDEPFRAWVPNV